MRNLAFNPEEVLVIAEQLSTGAGEASARSAISRAYYGAFLLAREVADIKDKTSKAHFMTWKHYADSGETQVANDLWSLRSARNLADYRTDLNVPRKTCDAAMSASRRISNTLRRIAGRLRYRSNT